LAAEELGGGRKKSLQEYRKLTPRCQLDQRPQKRGRKGNRKVANEKKSHKRGGDEGKSGIIQGGQRQTVGRNAYTEGPDGCVRLGVG